MKHRLASLRPTGRLWPSFPILLFFSFFLWRSKCCPSLSFLLSSLYLVGETVSKTGMGEQGSGGKTGRGVNHFMCITVQGPYS